MGNSKTLVGYQLTTTTLPKQLTNSHASLKQYGLHVDKPLVHLMNDASLKKILMNVAKKDSKVNPLHDKAMYDKYLVDLIVAANIDKKLIELLQQEANELYAKLEEIKGNILKKLEHDEIELKAKKMLRNEALLREKELLLASLNSILTQLESDLYTILGNCCSQIKFLSDKVQMIENEKRNIYTNLGNDFLSLLDKDEYKINGKKLFEIDPSLPQEEQNKIKAQVGEKIEKELVPLHQEIKKVQSQEAIISKEINEAEKELEKAQQALVEVDNLSEQQAKEALEDYYDNYEEGDEDDVLEALSEEERIMDEAEAKVNAIEGKMEKENPSKKPQEESLTSKEEQKLNIKFNKLQEKLHNKRETVKQDIDNVSYKREKIRDKRKALQERRDKLQAKVDALELKASNKEALNKLLNKKDGDFLYWGYKAIVANNKRKEIEKLDAKVTSLKSKENKLKGLKTKLFDKFHSTISKMDSLVHPHEEISTDNNAKTAMMMEILDKNPTLAQDATIKIKACEKAQQDCYDQINDCQNIAQDAKNKTDLSRQVLIDKKEALGKKHPQNPSLERLFEQTQQASSQKPSTENKKPHSQMI